MGDYAEAAYEGGFYTGNEGGRGKPYQRNKGKNARIKEAAQKFARAWVKWHDHSCSILDVDLVDAGHGIVEALGFEMVERPDGKHKLVPKVKP